MRRAPVLIASGVALGLALGGATVAVATSASHPKTVKVCVTGKAAVRAASAHSKCPKHTHKVTLNRRGPAGARGKTGAAGAIGTPGPKGLKGDAGAAGAKGDKGDAGAVGAKGDKGDPGATGAQGPGATGFAGTVSEGDGAKTVASIVGNSVVVYCEPGHGALVNVGGEESTFAMTTNSDDATSLTGVWPDVPGTSTHDDSGTGCHYSGMVTPSS